MEDTRYIVDAEQPPAVEEVKDGMSPQPLPGQLTPPPYMPYEYGYPQPPATMTISRNVDEAMISKIQLRSILSIVFSALAVCVLWPTLCCSIPAVVFAILALVGIQNEQELDKALSYSRTAMILTIVAVVFGVIATVVVVVLIVASYSTESYYYRY